MDPDMLTSVISINTDTIDGLGFDPVDVLGAQHAMIDARIEKQTIESSNILLPDKLNFFGLMQNPTSTVGTNDITSGSDRNKKLDIIYRTTVLADVTNIVDSSLPTPSEEYDVNLPTSATENSAITSTTTNGILIGGVTPSISIPGGYSASAELKNLSYVKSEYLVGVTFAGIKTNNTIAAIKQVPEFIQYTGKVLSTKQLSSDLTLSDTDSVIIRINMIKGM
jgi:hypothetical protein